jgi:hypothetical protein
MGATRLFDLHIPPDIQLDNYWGKTESEFMTYTQAND